MVKIEPYFNPLKDNGIKYTRHITPPLSPSYPNCSCCSLHFLGWNRLMRIPNAFYLLLNRGKCVKMIKNYMLGTEGKTRAMCGPVSP